MPLVLEILNKPLSDADQTDILKIFAEAPSWLRRDMDEHGFLNFWLDSCQHLYAARFNDRLLGCVGLSKEQDALRLIGLCVRKTTRRRGVADFLFEQIAANHPHETLLISCKQEASTDSLLAKAGYLKVGGAETDTRVEWIKKV